MSTAASGLKPHDPVFPMLEGAGDARYGRDKTVKPNICE